MSDIGPAILEAIEGLKGTVQSLDSRMAALEGKINVWPDIHFLQAAAQQQISEAREARDHRRDVEIKLDEIYGSSARRSAAIRVVLMAVTPPRRGMRR